MLEKLGIKKGSKLFEDELGLIVLLGNHLFDFLVVRLIRFDFLESPLMAHRHFLIKYLHGGLLGLLSRLEIEIGIALQSMVPAVRL